MTFEQWWEAEDPNRPENDVRDFKGFVRYAWQAAESHLAASHAQEVKALVEALRTCRVHRYRDGLEHHQTFDVVKVNALLASYSDV